ncbi:MAG: AAA family ATPase [Campylobacteraceae bacterium]
MNNDTAMVHAVYTESIGIYKENPFIEALPRPLGTTDIYNLFANINILNKEYIELSSSDRKIMIMQCMGSFFQPFSRHVELENKISLMIRDGYVSRNINNGDLQKIIQKNYKESQENISPISNLSNCNSTAKSLLFLGASGCGKTTSINKIMSTYPRAIFHEKYNFVQIPFLKIDAPHNSSLKELCLNFFRALDQITHQSYEKKYGKQRAGVEDLLAAMKQLVNTHAIGILIIDEIQHLNYKNSLETKKIMNFFVTLTNTINLPIVFIGTPSAKIIFDESFRIARRASGFGAQMWERFKSDDEEWEKFINILWREQILKKQNTAISNEIYQTLYELSQGIIDIAVKLFFLSQIRAIFTGLERITVPLLQNVYLDEFKPIHPMIDALRKNNIEAIEEYDDLTFSGANYVATKFIANVQSNESNFSKNSNLRYMYNNDEKAILLHNLLSYESNINNDTLPKIVKEMVLQYPYKSNIELANDILSFIRNEQISQNVATKERFIKIHEQDWQTLNSEDLRFIFSQSQKNDIYTDLKKSNYILSQSFWN